MAQQQIPQQQQTPRRERLMAAAEAGQIDGLYECIKDDPRILDDIDMIPFFDTPLHKAASAGRTHFVLEMMRLKPSFSWKLNPEGLSSLDLALRKREDLRRNLEDLDLPNWEQLSKLREELTQIVRQLITFDKQLIRVQGRESFTPLHYVAEKGDIELLTEFLLACPESIMDRTIRAETALHIAVKNKKLEACEVLLGWLRRSLNLQLLNSKDEKGNTVLHIAVSKSEIEIVKLFREESYMNMNEKNLEGLTALGIAAKLKGERPSEVRTDIEDILRGAGAFQSPSSPTHYSLTEFLKSPERRFEKIIKTGFFLETFVNQDFFSMTMETRNATLVVAVLVATSTYQAILNPPGGVRGLGGGDNNNQPTINTSGTLINAIIISTAGLPTNVSLFNATIFTPSATTTTHNPANQYGDFFTRFYFLNTVCFFFSIVTIVTVLPLKQRNFLLYLSIYFLIMSYACSFSVISPSRSNADFFFFGSYIFDIVFALLMICPISYGPLVIQVYMSCSHLLGERVEMLKLCLKGRPQKSD